MFIEILSYVLFNLSTLECELSFGIYSKSQVLLPRNTESRHYLSSQNIDFFLSIIRTDYNSTCLEILMKKSPQNKDGVYMKNVIVIGGLGAFATGIAITLQAYLSGRAGNLIGPIKTGLWTNFLGGTLAGLIILTIRFFGKDTSSSLTQNAFVMILISGALGIIIITGVAFSINLAGVTAGVAAIFLGQMVLSTIVDTMGWGGVETIPLDSRRIIGLIIMGISVVLLLPRK